GMAIKPYLIEVIGIDLWHAVEFSRYGCALILGLTAIGRAQPHPLRGRRRNLDPGSDKVKSPTESRSIRRAKSPQNQGFWLLGKFFSATRPGVEVRFRSESGRIADPWKAGKSAIYAYFSSSTAARSRLPFRRTRKRP
ncbi:MAG: hypothetical protein RLZZ79_23, partial [Actinomycetota bacterium]